MDGAEDFPLCARVWVVWVFGRKLIRELEEAFGASAVCDCCGHPEPGVSVSSLRFGSQRREKSFSVCKAVLWGVLDMARL